MLDYYIIYRSISSSHVKNSFIITVAVSLCIFVCTSYHLIVKRSSHTRFSDRLAAMPEAILPQDGENVKRVLAVFAAGAVGAKLTVGRYAGFAAIYSRRRGLGGGLRPPQPNGDEPSAGRCLRPGLV